MWSSDEGVVDVWRKARIEGVRILEAMVEERKDGRVETWLQYRLLGKGRIENGCVRKECGKSVWIMIQMS